MANTKSKTTEPTAAVTTTTPTRPGKILSWVMAELRSLSLPSDRASDPDLLRRIVAPTNDPMIELLVGRSLQPGLGKIQLWLNSGRATPELRALFAKRAGGIPAELLATLKDLDAALRKSWDEISRIATPTPGDLLRRNQDEAELAIVEGKPIESVPAKSMGQLDEERRQQLTTLKRAQLSLTVQVFQAAIPWHRKLVEVGLQLLRERVGSERAEMEKLGLTLTPSEAMLSIRNVLGMAARRCEEVPGSWAPRVNEALVFGWEEQ